MAPSRRAALLPLLLLGGCGFLPLHAPAAPGPTGGRWRGLPPISVARVPDRGGQLLRQALRTRLGEDGGALYELRIAPQLGREVQGFRRDGAPSRARLTVVAPWSLVALAPPAAVVAAGTARAFDAANIPDQEFFAGVQSAEAAERRLMEQVAEDVVERLRLALRDRPAPAA